MEHVNRPNRAPRRLALAALPLWCLGAGLAPAATFPATGGGAIPDNNPAGVQAFFNVQGLAGEIESVSVTVALQHSWAGDLTATLVSPDGRARLRLFGRVGARRGQAADSSDWNGTYTFSDVATNDLWQAAFTAGASSPIPAQAYRTTTAGVGQSLVGGCSSHLGLAFGGLQAAEANGAWTLQVTDSANSDTGTLSAAGTALTITTRASTLPDLLFRSGQEDNESGSVGAGPFPLALASSTVGQCTPGINDMDGDGLSDFVMVRNAAQRAVWTVKRNDLTANGTVFPEFALGTTTDQFLIGDFDGDGMGDPVAFRNGNPGRFSIRRSSRPDDRTLEIALGATGDTPRVSGDYDGDRVTDASVFQSASGAVLAYRQSGTGDLVTHAIPNATGAFGLSLRDANGNGKADFALQSNAGNNMGQFRVYDGLSGAQTDAFTLGNPTHLVIPGQVTGTPRTDITVAGGVAGQINFTTRDLESGTELPTVVFGQSATDLLTPGDYDGDGLLDLSVWRADAAPGASRFITRLSTTQATLEVPAGEAGQYAVNNWDVH